MEKKKKGTKKTTTTKNLEAAQGKKSQAVNVSLCGGLSGSLLSLHICTIGIC